MTRRNSNKDTITIDGWETEIEAAQAYNILAIIVNDEKEELNDVPPPSMETYKRVIEHLKRKGWRASQQDFHILKNNLRIRLGMNFPTDA